MGHRSPVVQSEPVEDPPTDGSGPVVERSEDTREPAEPNLQLWLTLLLTVIVVAVAVGMAASRAFG